MRSLSFHSLVLSILEVVSVGSEGHDEIRTVGLFDRHELIQPVLKLAPVVRMLLRVSDDVHVVARFISGDRDIVKATVFMKAESLVPDKIDVALEGHEKMVAILPWCIE